MDNVRKYTAYLPESHIDADDIVIARGVTAVDAMQIVFAHRDGWKTRVDETDYDYFTQYIWIAVSDKRTPERSFVERLQATVVKSGDAGRDKAVALGMIAAQVIGSNHLYWDGKIEADESFDGRLRRVAAAREVRRIDREISTKLVDALLSEGYAITLDLLEDEPEFVRSTDRDGILDHLWQLEMAEMAVHKGKERASISLMFDEEGWDLVRDYSTALEHIIDPICDPYLPWNRPDADTRDHGIRVLVLNSPDDVLKIEGMLE